MAERLNIRESIEKVMGLLQTRLADKWEAQGHRLTGSLEKSLKYEVTFENENWVGRMVSNDYGLILEFGVKPERIPYTPGGGRGGKSQYIQGIFTYWRKRGLNDREALGAAFATANVHRREGMPTRASYDFSRTGQRLSAIQEVLEESADDIRVLMEGDFEGLGIEILLAETKGLDIFKIEATV